MLLHRLSLARLVKFYKNDGLFLASKNRLGILCIAGHTKQGPVIQKCSTMRALLSSRSIIENVRKGFYMSESKQESWKSLRI